MQSGPFTITAPALGALGHSEAEVLGSVTWLWMHTPGHRDLPLHALNKLVLPALKTQQFILASAPDGDAMRPVAYLAWANFSADAESRYLQSAAALRPEDWNSGDRTWITDWFTPFGHSTEFRKTIETLLPDSCSRALYHRGNERGLRVMTFRGQNVSPLHAKTWWQARPMLAQPTPHLI